MQEDYDYASSWSTSTSTHGSTGAWPSAAAPQQDAFHDRQSAGAPSPTTYGNTHGHSDRNAYSQTNGTPPRPLTPTATPSQITLSAVGHKVHGVTPRSSLEWGDFANVDVLPAMGL